MKWRVLTFLCYFVGFNCFFSALFLPVGVQWLKVCLGSQPAIATTKADVKPIIAQAKKKPKIRSSRIAIND